MEFRRVIFRSNGLLESKIDRNIVHQHVERPTIANWLGSGSITETALKYFVEKAFDPDEHGNFDYVAENAKKPGITFPDYDEITESLKKIAGWRSEEHTSELQSRGHLVCRLLLEKKNTKEFISKDVN